MMQACLLSLVLSLLQVGTMLEDPAAEARAQDLMREIRCVACENEPISQSGSDIAADMRDRVRAMVAAGESDDDIRDWFVTRYGDFVLFRPRADGVSGGLLWGLPFFLLAVGAAWLVVQRREQDDAGSGIEAVPAEGAEFDASGAEENAR
jgi:cytochrome c-type biogenesis protein CcmH